MLVLSRKVGQQIKIGDAVVTVTRVVGGRVSLGIVAPDSVHILRGELVEDLIGHDAPITDQTPQLRSTSEAIASGSPF